MLTAIVLILFLLVFIIDYLPMRKTASKKEVIWYLALMSVGFCVLIIYSFGVTVPSPEKGIVATLNALFPQLAQ